MDLERLISILSDNGCKKVYVKTLAANDNSKNQVYLGGSFDVLNIFPISEVEPVPAGNWKLERFRASIDFAWIGEDGELYKAPGAQLILYPAYPEVRFSGFLARCENAPSALMTVREAGRLLFMAVTDQGQTIGYVTSPESLLANEFENVCTEVTGVFKVLELITDSRQLLIQELKRIYELDWINSKRLDPAGNIVSCNSPNCGGYTLEAELGITPNGYSDPDYLGWEVKQFGVRNFRRLGSAVITLMTPEPTEGLYVSKGIDYFIRTYGYEDRSGRPDRLNFGGVHKAGIKQRLTGLTLHLIGFNETSGKITDSSGKIVLIDDDGNEAAAWSFASMLKHWNRKHNQACYVPALSVTSPDRKYKFGEIVTLGTKTDFQLFLKQMAEGNIYYDPGVKMENVSTIPQVKKRSQFRIKSSFLRNLYSKNEQVNVTTGDVT